MLRRSFLVVSWVSMVFRCLFAKIVFDSVDAVFSI